MQYYCQNVETKIASLWWHLLNYVLK